MKTEIGEFVPIYLTYKGGVLTIKDEGSVEIGRSNLMGKEITRLRDFIDQIDLPKTDQPKA